MILLTVFYISHKSGSKTFFFLNQLINVVNAPNLLNY